MFTTNFYVVIAIVTLVALTATMFLRLKRGPKTLTPLASLAFGFVLAGIIFGEERVLAYSLMGSGIILAVIDMFHQAKGKKPNHRSP